MVWKVISSALVGASVLVVQPAFAEKVIDTQVGKFDLDPFNVLAPAAPPAPAAPEKPAKKKRHMKHHKKKKM